MYVCVCVCVCMSVYIYIYIYVCYRSLKKRPRSVLTDDGEHVLNIWFIPHYTESLIVYKKLPDDKCRAALTSHLKIVASLHDILQYLCAHSRLGTSSARMGSESRSITADWGGTEGIGQCVMNYKCKTALN